MLHRSGDLQCERCGSTENVGSTLRQHSYPHESDAFNTTENLPFGCSMLCDKCVSDHYAVVCKQMAVEDERCQKVAQEQLALAMLAGDQLTEDEQDQIYWTAYSVALYGVVEVRDDQQA